MEYINSTGRRKTSVARAYLKAGNGDISINGKSLEEYFPTMMFQTQVKQPFNLTETDGQYDVKIRVHGGGMTGQAEAIRHAISRALVQVNEDFKKYLKDEGFLTRDARMVERKKAGFLKARKQEQFRKR